MSGRKPTREEETRQVVYGNGHWLRNGGYIVDARCVYCGARAQTGRHPHGVVVCILHRDLPGLEPL